MTSLDEQQFLATLQECLQPDNDKRTAAEVRRCAKNKTTKRICFFFS